jgi:Uma2 family endonuclease
MSTATLIPLSEYLATTYRPDCDFLEGELKERNTGEQPHALIQGILYFLFRLNRDIWKTRPLPEQRVQVRPDRFRVPDVCVVNLSDPAESILSKPPVICIEVLSSSDSLCGLQERVNDYAAMGVQHIWIVDPWGRAGYYASTRGFQQPEDGMLRIPGTPIAISLAEVFAELDEV